MMGGDVTVTSEPGKGCLTLRTRSLIRRDQQPEPSERSERKIWGHRRPTTVAPNGGAAMAPVVRSQRHTPRLSARGEFGFGRINRDGTPSNFVIAAAHQQPRFTSASIEQNCPKI